jgi:predicted ArsR family transcriptional regulator
LHFVDIAVATGEFAQTVGDLGSSDVGKQLSQSFSGLAEVQRTAQEIQNAQSEQDMVTIMGTGELVQHHCSVIADNASSRRVCQTHQLCSGES